MWKKVNKHCIKQMKNYTLKSEKKNNKKYDQLIKYLFVVIY